MMGMMDANMADVWVILSWHKHKNLTNWQMHVLLVDLVSLKAGKNARSADFRFIETTYYPVEVSLSIGSKLDYQIYTVSQKRIPPNHQR